MTVGRALAMGIPLLLSLGSRVTAQEAEKPAPAMAIKRLTTDVQVAADGSNTQTTHVEVRAANEAGALQLGQTSIPYDGAAQEITVVEAHTLKADGKILPVEPSAIYDQASGQGGGMITGMRAKLIVFPQFVAGDTAVYTTKTVTRQPNFEKQFVLSEVFPRTVAYGEVRETVTAPKSFPLYAETHDVEASRREDGANVTYSWRYSAPKPIAEEPVTFAPIEHMPRFFISSFKDYAQLGQAYAALVEPKRVVTPKAKALADEITAGVTDQKIQAQKIYEWVSGRIRYVAILLGTGSFVPHDVDSIIGNGYGDCKDHDLLLHVLLKAKGIEAESILINSGGSYTMTGVPTFTTLNHVITYLPQFDVYLDSSVGMAPFGILPLQEYGKPMVVASTKTPRLGRMPVLKPGIAKLTLKTVSTVDKDGSLSGTATTVASGPYAVTSRIIGLGIQALGPSTANRLLMASGHENPTGSITQTPPTGFAPDHSISVTYKSRGWADYLSGKNSFYLTPACGCSAGPATAQWGRSTGKSGAGRADRVLERGS